METNSKPTKHAKFRLWVQQQHVTVQWLYKAAVVVAGVLVIITGLILVPLPGPGWLIVFVGVALLGLEFPAAARLNRWVKDKVVSVVAQLRKKSANQKLS